MLQLRHVLFGRGFFRECPGQHELGLEDRASCFNPAVEGGRHPTQYWMADVPPNVGEDLAVLA
jgi:hypothetical protein